MLNRKFKDIRIDNKLTIGKNATVVATSTAGAETVIDMAELAALNSIGASDLAKIDGITNGTQAAGKAVVADNNVNTGVSKVTQLHIGATGSETQVTATAAELNYNDIATLGTGAASKAVVLDAGEDYTWPATGILTYGVLKDGAAGDTIVASGAEINRTCDNSTRVIVVGSAATIATTLSITQATHESKVVVLANTHTMTLTLPAATGSGAKYNFVVNTVGTDGSKIIKVANTYDVMTGVCIVNSSATDQASSFLTTATDDTITFDNTTTGGISGTKVEIIDIATSQFYVEVSAASSGTVATCFSAGV